MTLLKKILLGLAAVAALFLVLFIMPVPVHSQVASITLDWTAPGDDGASGTASTYEMRWSSTKPDTTTTAAMNSWWAGATQATGMPAPLLAGTAQSKIVAGPFTTGATYYFVMRASDEVPNWSAYSNVAIKFLPDSLAPSRVIDLRTR